MRKSGGYNAKRLLIISENNIELELSIYYKPQIPEDPSNKTAISIHYYFPSKYDNNNTMKWLDKKGDFLLSSSISIWKSLEDYNTILNHFHDIKDIYLDRGIPVVIGEVGIITEDNNTTSFREFLYTLFSLTSSYDGIMACLWDNPLNIDETKNYYNRQTNKWNDKIIQNFIFKISTGKFINYEDYYYISNYEVSFYDDYCLIDVANKKLSTIYIYAKVYGKIGIDFDIVIGFETSNDGYDEIFVKREHGKKNYDGITTYTINTIDTDNYEFIFILIDWGFENVIMKNITCEYKEKCRFFDVDSYKNEILKNIILLGI